MKRSSSSLLAAVLALAVSAPAAADGERYHAVAVPESGRLGGSANLGPKVFILDTEEGHMWTWGENEAILAAPPGQPRFGTILRYEGRLRPGRAAGDVIESDVER